MNKLLNGYQFVFAAAYVDDCLVWSTDWSSHLTHSRLVLSRIRESGLRLRPDKCQFAQIELRFLGMILSKDKIAPDPAKLELIKNAPAPKSAKMPKSFLGLCGFYRRFIRDYSKICEPFRNLLRKNVIFEWNNVHENASNKIKQAMASAPLCLSIPNWHDTIVLICGSSRQGCGYIIAEECASTERQRVLAYGGRAWNKHEKQYSFIELEAACILYALETNSQYFLAASHQATGTYSPSVLPLRPSILRLT